MQNKLFLDANVFLDMFLERHGAEHAKRIGKIFLMSQKNEISLCVSTVSCIFIEYVLSKSAIPRDEIQGYLQFIDAMCEVYGGSSHILSTALDLGRKDFEDSVQYCISKEYGCTHIITSNSKDFECEDMQVMTSDTYLGIDA